MQAVAAGNNLSETAFLVPEDGNYRLRWFTPPWKCRFAVTRPWPVAVVVMERLEPGRSKWSSNQQAPSDGEPGAAGYIMNFPVRLSEPVTAPPGPNRSTRRGSS